METQLNKLTENYCDRPPYSGIPTFFDAPLCEEVKEKGVKSALDS